jgi:hypothetical protein
MLNAASLRVVALLSYDRGAVLVLSCGWPFRLCQGSRAHDQTCDNPIFTLIVVSTIIIILISSDPQQNATHRD